MPYNRQFNEIVSGDRFVPVKCEVPGCHSSVVGRGMCKVHYRKDYWQRVKANHNKRAQCSVDGCTAITNRKAGVCLKHDGEQMHDICAELDRRRERVAGDRNGK